MKIITKEIVNQLGLDILRAIKENTQRGRDKWGHGFKPYSERPFAMPYGGVFNKTKTEQAIKAGDVSFFRNTKGEVRKATNGMWITWRGGYKQYKGYMTGANTDIVDFTFSGKMLVNLTVTDTRFDKPVVFSMDGIIKGLEGEKLVIPTITVTIGFDSEKQAQKAEWNIEKGRDFLGLPDEQLQEIIDDWVNRYLFDAHTFIK